MEYSNLNKNLVCILFPGIVKNHEKALQCLGGIRNISQIYSQPKKKRIGLSFQPENPYIKKTYADAYKAAGVLLKIKVKKTKVDNEVKKEVVSTMVLGRVTEIYKFESMCEFQFLPIHIEGVGRQPQCILEQILPSGTDTFGFMQEPAPSFIVPSSFTRSDKPISYTYTEKKYPDRKDMACDGDDADVHNKTRAERGMPLNRYSFSLIDNLPTEPQDYYIKQKEIKLAIYPQMTQEYETVKKHFEERPIWSLNLIKYHTKIRLVCLKIIMPCLAMYMKDGPWKSMWVRYGYDPRKEPGARIYQSLDFRLRHAGGFHSMVMTRDQIGSQKKADRVRHSKKKNSEEPPPSEEVSEGAVYFRPGMVPSQRQIFYQFCDVKLPEVEELLAADPPPGYLCHQKRGWLPPNSSEICRDHIFRYVKETLLSTHSADMKFEQESSDDEQNSEDESGAVNDIDEAS